MQFSDYELVAQGYGGTGKKITRDNASDMAKIFKEAKEISRNEGKSVLLNVLIGKTNFREGSISV